MASYSTKFKKYTLVANEELERLRHRNQDNAKYDPKITTLTQLQQDMRDLLSRSDIAAEEKMGIFQQLRHFFENIKNTSEPDKSTLPISKPTVPTPAPSGPPPPPPPAPPAQPPSHPQYLAQQSTKDQSSFNLGAYPDTEFKTPSTDYSAETFEKLQPASSSSTAKFNFDIVSKFIDGLSLPDRRIPKARNLFIKILNNGATISWSSLGTLCLYGKEIEKSSFKDLFRELFIDKTSHNKIGLDKFINALCKIHVRPDEISNKLYKSSLETISPFQAGKGNRVILPPGKRIKILRVYPI